MTIDEARVVLRLRVKVSPAKRAAFLAFCARAFPVYESVGGLQMALYEEKEGRFDEVAYYATPADHARSERALEEDPAQRALIAEWRALLEGPPEVLVERRLRLP